MNSIRLGEYLVQRGLISEVQLTTALQQQQRTGERLGRLLLILNFIRRIDLARALADLWQLPFVTIDEGSVDPRVAQRVPLDATLQHRAVPLREDAHSVTVAVADAPAPELRSILEIIYPGKTIDFRVTTEWDIDRAIASIHRRKVVDTSIYGLYFRDQAESAFTVFTLPQYLAFVFFCAALLAGLWLSPSRTMLLLNIPITGFFLIVVVFRTWVGVTGAAAETAISISDDDVRAVDNRALPVYSILVPVFMEDRVIGTLLRALRDLDYPADKLDIMLLFEEDDPQTLAA
ncbi:MAG: glycosyl transferase, partial [Acidobacteriota bacterium]